MKAVFASTGRLRASINVSNPILAARDGASAIGVSVDLAREFARRLGVEPELVVFDGPAKAVEAVGSGRTDIGFFAIDPRRGEQVAFTAPYVLIEGSYIVRKDSPLQANEEVDRAGHRVVVGAGSAYDLFLTRELKHAAIERAPSSAAVVPQFLASGADAGAGIRQPLEAHAARDASLRVLPGRFMVIRQAMGCPRAFGDEALRFLAAFVEDMKASGFVAQALARHGIEGAGVAPAGD
jgi:polar amino acid transport system substrate-binding protein